MDNDKLTIVGWVTAFLLPMVGVFVAMLLMRRGDPRWKRIMVTSVVVFLLPFVIVLAVLDESGTL